MRMAGSATGAWRRIILLALIAVTALALDGDRKPAQGAAWCLVGGDSGRSCGYYTFEQCQASRAGGSTHCVQNPNDPGGGRSDASRSGRR
jgi:Protein of unknown function (DUF3551)